MEMLCCKWFFEPVDKKIKKGQQKFWTSKQRPDGGKSWIFIIFSPTSIQNLEDIFGLTFKAILVKKATIWLRIFNVPILIYFLNYYWIGQIYLSVRVFYPNCCGNQKMFGLKVCTLAICEILSHIAAFFTNMALKIKPKKSPKFWIFRVLSL